MRVRSWLTSLYLHTVVPTYRSRVGTGLRRRRLPAKAAAAISEQLERRQLLATGAAAVGFETHVNTFTPGNQDSAKVATDTAGDYVITWQSNSQDGSGAGIYAQRYNAAGTPQGGEFHVNSYTTGDQDFPSVAMDSAGDFVIAWQSNGQDAGDYEIYARRYNAAGVAQRGEFQVNSYTTGTKEFPTVGMDSTGDFVITWASVGQDGSGAGIYAQRYNAAGTAQGSEFQVNIYTTGDQLFPSIAMDSGGAFVIAWQSNGQDLSGNGIYAQRYNAVGTAQGGEFQVNTYTTGDQSLPTVAMDSGGDFVITWQSNGQDGSNYGVYAQRYNAVGAIEGVEFRANTYTTNLQGYPSVSMDSAGDFVMCWQSNGQDGSSYGVYAQRYTAVGAPQGSEFLVNTFTTNGQAGSSVAMDASGDFVIAWQSYGQDGSLDGVYAQRFVATVGPIVTGVFEGTGPRVIQNGDRLTSSVTALSVQFSDNMNTVAGGANSVINASNWLLTDYGVDVSNLISNVTFGFNAATNRYSAVVSFKIPLANGGYQIVVRQAVHDLTGRGLDGEADGRPGGDFRRNFYVATTLTSGSETLVNTHTTNGQRDSRVALDSAGDHVITWDSNQDGSNYGVYAQRYNAAGTAQGGEFQVNSYTTNAQWLPSVSMDSAGAFVITWQSIGQDGSGYGIYAQRYNAAGTPQGGEFQVNTYTMGSQKSPSVAMDSGGDFVITWDSDGQDGSSYGVYAQRYNAAGTAQGGEFQVNTYTTDTQGSPFVSMDSAGDFVVTWESYRQDGSSFGVYAQRYSAAGVAQGGEFQVNTYTTNGQFSQSVAMDSAGDFVITWDSDSQDGSAYGVYAQRYNAAGTPQGGEFRVNTYTTSIQRSPSVAIDSAGAFVITWESFDGSGYGVYAQRYNAAGTAQGSEFQVNTYTTSQQALPSVSMDSAGDFVIAWQSYGQDGSGYGVYAQRYKADVAPFLYQIEPTALNASAPLTTPIASSLLVFDQDSNNWTGATIQIAENYRSGEDVLGFSNASTPKITGTWNAATGTLTLSGSDTVSDYRTALHNVTYHNTSATPSTALPRTITFQVSDGLLSSNVISRDVNVLATSNPAVLSGVSGTGTYDENTPPIAIGSSLAITDPDTNFLTSGTVSFTNWQGEDRVNFNNIFALQHTFTENLSAHTASLTITGSDTVDHYQTLLRSVVYWDVSLNPVTAARIASFTVSDGLSNSNPVTRDMTVVVVNQPPVLSGIETAPLVAPAGVVPQPISSTLLVSDPDSNNCTKATVQITSGYENDANGHDVLSFVNQNGITGSFNATTGLLTLTGTSSDSNYRTALRSLTFSTSGTHVSTAARTLTIVVVDDSGTPTATSLPITRTVTVPATDIPPGLTGIPATSLAYARGAAAVAVAPSALLFDADSLNLASATIQITANYQNGLDTLSATAITGMTMNFNDATGTLTLSGTLSLADYQAAIQSVTFKTSSSTNTNPRTLTFILNDGAATSSPVSRYITLK